MSWSASWRERSRGGGDGAVGVTLADRVAGDLGLGRGLWPLDCFRLGGWLVVAMVAVSSEGVGQFTATSLFLERMPDGNRRYSAGLPA